MIDELNRSSSALTTGKSELGVPSRLRKEKTGQSPKEKKDMQQHIRHEVPSASSGRKRGGARGVNQTRSTVARSGLGGDA